jgi:hypothetical protein
MSIATQEANGTVTLDADLWQTGVQLVSDAMFRLADKAVQSRLDAGTALARTPGKIKPGSAGVWHVQSDSGTGWYTVNGACNCPDVNAPEGKCKHRWATGIVTIAQQLTPAMLAMTPEEFFEAYLEAFARMSHATRPPVAPPRQSRFARATKTAVKLRMALLGPAGSGKSFTALTLAQALGERIAVIDTEHGGARLYADRFTFDTLELTSFHPQRYVEALEDAAAEGYEVVIVDSLSHAWVGTDGALELHARETKRSKSGNSYAAWRDVTPLHNQLVETLLRMPCHVLVTVRSKMEYVMAENGKGKQDVTKVGMQPIQKEGLEYEFDIVGDMDRQHTLVVTKSRFSALDEAMVEKPGRAFGDQIKAALGG